GGRGGGAGGWGGGGGWGGEEGGGGGGGYPPGPAPWGARHCQGGDEGSCRDHRAPVPGRGVDRGGEPAKDRSAGAAGEGEQGGLGDELHCNVGPGGTKSPAQPDLAPSFQDGDHHDVGDPDAADEQGDAAEGQEQALEGDGGVGARGERVRGVGDRDVLRGGRVGGRGENPGDSGHAGRAGPDVDLHGGAVGAQEAAGNRKADEGGAVQFGGER